MNHPVGDPDVIFFSRGFGRGHAIPDLAILEALGKIAPQVRVCLCSYGSGLQTIRQAGQPAFDLDLPELCTEWQVVARAGQFLRRTSPRLVIGHEEFGAIPAARIFGLPTAFITHWFGPEKIPSMQALAGVDRILFIEAPGHFPEPHFLQGRIDYVGSVLRRFRFLPSDRKQLRKELNVACDETIVTCFLGSWGEEKSPVCDLILEAFQGLPRERKRLIWVASRDFAIVAEKCSGKEDVTVLEWLEEPERIMIASDLAITKGTYNVGKELEAIGVPSISLSHGRNPIDDHYSRCLSNNTFLYADETSPRTLISHMEALLQRGPGKARSDVMDGSGAVRAAEWLIHLLSSLTEKLC